MILEDIDIHLEPFSVNSDRGVNFSVCWKPVLWLISNQVSANMVLIEGICLFEKVQESAVNFI